MRSSYLFARSGMSGSRADTPHTFAFWVVARPSPTSRRSALRRIARHRLNRVSKAERYRQRPTTTSRYCRCCCMLAAAPHHVRFNEAVSISVAPWRLRPKAAHNDSANDSAFDRPQRAICRLFILPETPRRWLASANSTSMKTRICDVSG